MYRYVAVAALTLALATEALAAGWMGKKTVGWSYDKMEDTTTVRSLVKIHAPFMSGMNLTFEASYLVPGKEQKAPVDEIWLQFSESTNVEGGWQYLDDHGLIFLLDGEERLKFEGEHAGDVGGRLTETVSFLVNRGADVEKITAAKKVEVRFGKTEFTLSPKEIARLKDLAEVAALPAPAAN